MFRISRRLDYGLQLLVELAKDVANKPQATSLLAEKLQMPLPFLHQIGHSLEQAGMIKANPGPHGGLRLITAPESITLLEVVETLEGPLCVNPCLDCGEICPRQEDCISRTVWFEFQGKIKGYLESIHLNMLVNEKQPIKVMSYSFSDN
jgi:Rrf2 family protein